MKKWSKWLLLCMVVGCLAGCGQMTEDSGIDEKTESVAEKQEEQEEDVGEDIVEQEEDDAAEEALFIKIYYIDESTGERISETLEADKLEPEYIWQEFQSRNLLDDQCEMNSFSIDETDRKIDLDVNEEFGEYIRSMGTAGEEEILECLIASYLDSYGCEKIKITENGSALDTGHTVLDAYIGKD